MRDSLLGLKSKDIDYAVETSCFEAMRGEMINRGFVIFQENPEFLTIRAKFPGSKLVGDFVLCRKESGYTNGRHPENVEPGTIFDDLRRRDFTVNAIAKCVETGKLIDPHNGVGDLKQGILKAVGDPDERFNEDALRVLRALRFSITKGLTIEENTWISIITFEAKKLGAVSVDRRREELHKMFSADSLQAMELLMSIPGELREEIGVHLREGGSK